MRRVGLRGGGRPNEWLSSTKHSTAAKWEVPVLFAVEDNGYAQSSRKRQTLAGSIAGRAAAFDIRYFEADITDVPGLDETCGAATRRAIQAERERRVLNGTAAREAACRHFVKAPGILDQIMTDAHSNPRHKIEAIRELRQTAVGDSADRPAESGRFIIKIDLTAGGGDVETYSKPIVKIDVSDGDCPNNLIPLEGKPDDNE